MLSATIGSLPHGGAEPAIDAGDQPFAIDDPGVAADALRHQPGMLDEVRGRIDHARNQNLVVGDVDVREVFPFVIVARIGGLDADGLWCAP